MNVETLLTRCCLASIDHEGLAPGSETSTSSSNLLADHDYYRFFVAAFALGWAAQPWPIRQLCQVQRTR